MKFIKTSLTAILLFFSLYVVAQKSVNDDPETVINSIEYNIRQAQSDIDKTEYYEAVNKLNTALNLSNKIDNKKYAGFITAKIGKLHYLIGENDEGLKTLTKAVEIQRNAKDEKNLAETYKIFGDVFFSKKKYSQALQYYTSAQTLLEKKNLYNRLSEIYLSIAKCRAQLKEYDTAKEYVDLALEFSSKNDQYKTESEALIENANLLSFLGEHQKSNEALQQGLKIAKDSAYTSTLKNGFLTASNINDRLKNYEASNMYLRAYHKLSDSVLEAKKSTLSPKRRLELSDNDNLALLDKNSDNLEEFKPSTLNKLTTILSIALITILSLLTLSLYKNNNIRLKTNNILYKKNDELVVAKEKAELATKTKANFLSTVTHELRTPLYAVIGLTNMLLEENPRPEQISHLKSLKFSGDYLLTFINDILQLNKIEANKVSLDPEIFNLKKKVKNVINALNNSAKDNNVKLHFEYDSNIPETFNADQLKISQILINLIGNSIKFTKDGDIWVKVNKVKEQNGVFTLRFDVQDNGIGISKEKQKSLFESFNQGSVQINRKYGGTGLGLSIVKGLIDIMKGNISLTSELGKGSTFSFEIPLEYTEKVVEEAKQSYFDNMQESELKDIKILVVEDNKINQMITKKILNKMNLNCELVDNGEEAVDRVKTNNYDIVLMDIHMPGISGIEATKIIRTFDKELTIFALTAVTIEDKMQEFDEAGFDDIISKPFKQEDFEKKLHGALAEKNKISA